MEKRKFGLLEHVFLITGAKRAAIYNLKSGDVYSVDEKAQELLSLCEQNLILEEIACRNTSFKFNENEVIAYLDQLVGIGLGQYLADDETIQKINLEKTKDPLFDFVWLEITGGCNLQCVHCYTTSSPQLIKTDKMRFEDWLSVITQAADLKCRKLQFIGGEPLLLGNQLVALIEYARKQSFEFVKIFTNATILSERILKTLVEYRVNIAVSLYGSNSLIHERITQRKGSYSSTIRNIKRMLESGLEVRAAIIGMSLNQDDIKATRRQLEKLGVKSMKADIIRPSGRGRNNELISDKLVSSLYLTKPVFPKCTKDIFIQRRSGHNCFFKKICVTPSGDVYPCIMERDISYGNVLEVRLYDILTRKTTEEIRGLSKDNINVCRDCEYCYACFDCRPRAKNMRADGDLRSKPKECLYNPYSGEWKSFIGVLS